MVKKMATKVENNSLFCLQVSTNSLICFARLSEIMDLF